MKCLRIYLDVYFILNLILNLFVVGMTGALRGKRLLYRRICLASAVAALCSTIVYAVHFFVGKWLLLLGMAGMPILVKLSFPTKSWREFRGDCLLFLLASLVTGGALTAELSVAERLLQGMDIRSGVSLKMIVSGLVGIFLAFLLLAHELVKLQQNQKTTEEAVLSHGGKSYPLRVLFDTGNQLVSPYTGERVAILASDLAGELELAGEQNPLYIPYHSIGGSGVLPAYRLELLQMDRHGPLEHFLAAVSDELGQEQDIQMIVNIT